MINFNAIFKIQDFVKKYNYNYEKSRNTKKKDKKLGCKG